VRVSIQENKYSEAVKILERLPVYWRSRYIAEAVVFYYSTQNNKKESNKVSKDEKSGDRHKALLGA
jgi:hypothetical protein